MRTTFPKYSSTYRDIYFILKNFNVPKKTYKLLERIHTKNNLTTPKTNRYTYADYTARFNPPLTNLLQHLSNQPNLKQHLFDTLLFYLVTRQVLDDITDYKEDIQNNITTLAINSKHLKRTLIILKKQLIILKTLIPTKVYLLLAFYFYLLLGVSYLHNLRLILCQRQPNLTSYSNDVE